MRIGVAVLVLIAAAYGGAGEKTAQTSFTATRRSTIAAVDVDRDQQLGELAAAAQRGDGEALERLCTELQRFVRGFFWNKFQDANLVDELTQETYLRMLKNFKHLRDTSRVRAFVAKVAFHVSQDHLRRKYRSREEALEPLLERGSEPVEPTTSAEERVVNGAALESALAELPDKARQILTLKTEGLKYEEISQRLGLSVSGVKMQVKRSMEKLRGSIFLVTFLLVEATLRLGHLSALIGMGQIH